jgi:F-type H+-transporting ATPase subunit delta
MSISRIAGRYAKSLIDLATEQGNLANVVRDMKNFKVATTNPDLANMLKSPIIKADKKIQVADVLFSEQYDAMTMGFIRLCINKGREPQLADIADELLNQYKTMQNITSVKLTTATPLDATAVESIRQKMEQSKETNKSVELETAVDPSLIGGFKVEFGDQLYDASVAHKLELLKKEFSN